MPTDALTSTRPDAYCAILFTEGMVSYRTFDEYNSLLEALWVMDRDETFAYGAAARLGIETPSVIVDIVIL